LKTFSLSRNRVRVIFIASALSLTVLLGWLFLVFAPPCSSVACARPRFDLRIDLVRLEGAESLDLERAVNEGDRVVDLFTRAGLKTTLVSRKKPLPLLQTGTVTVGDLFAYRRMYRENAAGNQPEIYAIEADSIQSDSPGDVFGLLFDFQDDANPLTSENVPRSGIAVATNAMRARFSKESEATIEALKLRSFAHEISHAVNRSHSDAVRLGALAPTLEAPTACLAKTTQNMWTLVHKPVWAFSPSSIEWIQYGEATKVLPGIGHDAFYSWKSTLDDCQDLTPVDGAEVSKSKNAYAIARLRKLWRHPSRSLIATPTITNPQNFELRLQAQDAAYPLGYPISIRAILRNVSGNAVTVPSNVLNERAGSNGFEIRAIHAGAASPWSPPYFADIVGAPTITLSAGETLERTIPVFFGNHGWTFKDPTEYSFSMTLNIGSAEVLKSPPIKIQIASPRTPRDSAALELIQSGGHDLSYEIGVFEFFEGRVYMPSAFDRLLELSRRFPDTALGAAANLSLGKALLMPPINPSSGRVEASDSTAGKTYLNQACSDSGVSARAGISLPEVAASGTKVSSLWNGIADHGSIVTESILQPESMSGKVLFCTDSASLEKKQKAWIKELVSELRKFDRIQVAVAGHADSRGSCGANDELALMRAREVAVQLADAGMNPSLIHVISFGSRHPADFGADEAAWQRNRRAEIYVDKVGASSLEASSSIIAVSCESKKQHLPDRNNRSRQHHARTIPAA
jgi:outer membrane protein OmpA-like peptidoglycan-associated protein